MDLEIYHISGQLIDSYADYSPNKRIDISDLPAGSYLAVMQDKLGTKYQKKFIKQ